MFDTADLSPLDAQGFALLPALFDAQTCERVIAGYEEEDFRAKIEMARHGFGQDEYKFFAYPLPPDVETRRQTSYPHLAAIANRWAGLLGQSLQYPETLDDYLSTCHAAGQTRHTPLLLKCGPGDFNRLHQDLYGELHFPLQLAVLLSAPGKDFTGGEFILTEQRPRMRTKVEVVPLRQGDGVVFAVHPRPVHGTRGVDRALMRHGASQVRRGARATLGVIFHDAR